MEATSPTAPSPVPSAAPPKLSLLERLRLQVNSEQQTHAPVPVSIPGRSVQNKADHLTFVAIFVKVPPFEIKPTQKSVSYEIIPYNMPELARLAATPIPLPDEGPGVTAPLYSAATADGLAIKFNVASRTTEEPGQKKKRTTFHRLPNDRVNATAVLAYPCPILISEWGNKPRQFEPITLVRVHNATYRTYTDKEGHPGAGFNSDILRADSFAAFNAMPIEWRMAQLFPSDLSGGLADVGELEVLAQTLQAAFATGAGVISGKEKDKNVQRKAKEKFVRPLIGSLTPATLLSANRKYELGEARAPNLGERQMLARPPPLVVGPSSGEQETLTSVALVQTMIFRPAPSPTGDEAKGEDKLSLKASFVVQAFANNGSLDPVFSQFFPDVEVYKSNFERFPVPFPAFIQALFERHPIPFHVLATLDVCATLEDAELGKTGPDFPQGRVHAMAGAFVHELSRYIRRYGIPCTRELVVKRYGGEVVSIDKSLASGTTATPNDKAAAGALKAQRKAVFKTEVEESVSTVLEREGVACLDAAASSELPSASEVDFFALNLAQLPTPPPEVAGGDPALFNAVDLSPETGAKFILDSLGAKQQWLQNKVTGAVSALPVFLFFAVRRQQAASSAETTGVIESQLRGMFFPEGPIAGAEALPPTVGELRRLLACELAGVSYAPPKQGLKQPREDAEVDEDLQPPPTKRPRILDAMKEEDEDPMEEDEAGAASAPGPVASPDDDDGDFDD
jgi:hypothetical protein